MAKQNNNSRQYVWIVRYGLTEFPLVEFTGPFDSDIDPTEGIAHANAIANRIRSSGSSMPSLVYSSPFLRTVHTADIIASALPKPRVCVEEGLTEWQVSSLLVTPDGKRTYPKLAGKHAKTFDSIDLNYKSLNPAVNDDDGASNGAPQFPETEETLMKRCSMTLEKMLQHSNGESIAIVSHAPCDIAMALHLLGDKSSSTSLDAWPLGGLTLFSRQKGEEGGASSFGEWQIEFYGDSDHMPGDYKAGLKRWTLPSLQK